MTYAMRLLVRRSDGQLLSYAWDDIPTLAGVLEETEAAMGCIEDFAECAYPEETARADERALFAWRHRGWGEREGVA